MKLIHNSGSDRVIDLIRPHLKPGNQLDCVTPSFSLFAFAELREALKNLDRVQLIVSSDNDALAFMGSEGDRAARNRLQARWLANQCAKWIADKVDLRRATGSVPQGALVLRAPNAAPEQVVSFTGFSDSLESAYSARTGQIYAGMSYALNAGVMTFAPFGEIAHVWHSSERFAETGGLAALAAEKVDTSVTFSTLGLRLGTEINLGQSRAEFGAEIGWQHAVDQPEASVHALRAGGDRFTVAGAPIAEDALSLGLGGRLALSDRASLSLGYNADLAKQYENHAFRAGLSFAF